jgi:hypothetical protein
MSNLDSHVCFVLHTCLHGVGSPTTTAKGFLFSMAVTTACSIFWKRVSLNLAHTPSLREVFKLQTRLFLLWNCCLLFNFIANLALLLKRNSRFSINLAMPYGPYA